MDPFETMKTFIDIWDPFYYRRLRSDYARRSYVRHLLELGYTKAYAPGGFAMYPPPNWWEDLLRKKAEEKAARIAEVRLPYKD